ncbi:9878_t:CDS:2 [Ambispora gerdemannii]|uniref:9878_t:CDS:1 n=1 Tax=Ambispora gerdemannii TaxID=144530 RepID=A0A9N8WG06_9GLOM|nr:9878_t:CDS:2 [Ambispora gerdemannii]
MGNCLDKLQGNGTNSDPRSIIIPLTGASSVDNSQCVSFESEQSNNNSGNHPHKQRKASLYASNDHLSMLHALFKYTWQANFLAPVHEKLEFGNARVLNLGRHTGEWVLDVSDKYPLAKVWGIDTSNFSSNFSASIPLNSVFLHIDVLKGLPFADNTFDLIHTQCLTFTFTEIEWEKVMKEFLRVLKPGIGWLSLLEINLFYTNEGPSTAKLTDQMRLFLKEKKINPDIAILQENLLHASNQFTEIQVHERFHTLESNVSRAGEIAAKEFALTMYALGRELSDFMGLDNEEFMSLVESSVKEFNAYKTRARQTRIIARKNL